MTEAQLLALIESVVTDQTAEGAITPTTLGGLLANIVGSVEVVDDQPKEYIALLTHLGAGPMTVVVLRNTTGATVTFTVDGDGRFDITSNILVFTEDKTCIEFGAAWNNNDATVKATISATWMDAGYIRMRTFGQTDPENGMLHKTMIKITIFP